MTPISVCMIAKNEERYIENCLIALRKYDWEIVVVDTGSTDRTKETAQKYADKVLDFPWTNDFSAARNFSISQASHDAILILDCDEYLTQIELDEICDFFRNYPDCTGRITIRNLFRSNNTQTASLDYVERVFRRSAFHYRYPIHEQLSAKDGMPHKTLTLPITIEHYGYDLTPEEQQKKAKRNIDLLLSHLEKEPDNPYVLFQIGQTFFMFGDYESACPYFSRSLALEGSNEKEYMHLLLTSYGYSLLHTEQLEEALHLLQAFISRYETSDFCCLAGSIYLKSGQFVKAMAEFLKAMHCETFHVEDARHNIPLYNMGYINELLGDTKTALLLYKRCMNFAMADERIHSLEAEGGTL